MTTEDIIKLVLQYTGTKELKEGAEASKELKTALEDVGKAEEATQGKTEKLKEALEKAKGVLENFQSGGVGSSTKPLFDLLGLIPGAGPAFTLLGNAVEKAVPWIKTASEYLHTAGEKAGEFKAWLDKTATSVKDMTAYQKDLNAEVESYIGKLGEKEAKDKTFFEQKGEPTDEEERQQKRAKDYAQLTRGIQPDVLKELTALIAPQPTEEEKAAIEKQYKARVAYIMGLAPAMPEVMTKAALLQAQKERRTAMAPGVEEAAGMLQGAMTGDIEAIRAIQEKAPPGSRLAKIMATVSPEGQKEERNFKAAIADAEREAAEAQTRESAKRKEDAALSKEADEKRIAADRHITSATTTAEFQRIEKSNADTAKALADAKKHAPTPEQQRQAEAMRATSRVFQQETGQRASPEQARMMGDEAIKNLGIVGNYNQARDLAVMAEITRIKAAIDQMRGQVQGMSAAARFGPQPMRESNQTWGMAP